MNHLRNTLIAIVCGVGLFSCASQSNTKPDGDSTGKAVSVSEAILDTVTRSSPIEMFKEDSIRATGNEPFWLLELNKDSIHFKLMSGFEFRELLPTPTINSKDSLQYDFKTGPSSVTVLFQNKECTDDMSGFRSPFTVSMTFTGPDNTQNYNGCGDYLSAFNKIREQKKP